MRSIIFCLSEHSLSEGSGYFHKETFASFLHSSNQLLHALHPPLSACLCSALWLDAIYL